VGTFVACVGFGSPIAVALGGSTANLLEALAAAAVVRRVAGRWIAFDSLHAVGALVLGGAIASNAVTSFLGAWLLRPPSGAYWDTYFDWWGAHGLGMLIIAPVILVLSPVRAPRPISRAHAVELTAYLIGLSVASYLILGAHAGAAGAEVLDPYAVLPLLVIGALRFGSVGPATSTIVAAATLWHAAQQRGPFVDFATSPQDEALDIYFFLLLGSVLSLLVSAILQERRTAEHDASERARHAACVADVALALTGRASIEAALDRSARLIQSHLDVLGVRIATFGPVSVVATATPDGAPPPSAGEVSGFPLLIDDRAVGTLDVTSVAPLTERSLETLASVARALALGIERHEAENGRQRLADILAAAPDFVSIAQDGGVPVYLNPAARRLFGLGPTEPAPSLFSYRPPQFRAFFENTILPAVVADGIWRGETEYVTPEGRTVPISQVSVAHRDESGTLRFVSTVSRDISAERAAAAALRESEERMRFALHSARVGLWEANLVTGAAFWSDTCEALHGMAPGTFGRSFDAFMAAIHPEDRAHVGQDVAEAVRDRRETELEYRTTWPDGSEHLIRSTAHFYFDDGGAPIRGAGVALDITDRRALEDQFRQAQKMEAVGRLAGGIAHDFNNLLTAIQGYARLVYDSFDTADQRREDVDEIVKASTRAAALTRQLLAFSRKQILSTQVLQVGDVVGALMPMLRRLLGESIDLETVFHDTGRVRADAGQLEQVLVNLAVNAKDAMPDGGRMTIETGELELDAAAARLRGDIPPGRYMTLVVSDTGCGMNEATKRRLFEPFFTTKPLGQGTGLGLATVHGIVNQSGGHIWVYSEPDHGTTFKVCLPRTEETEAAETLEEVAPAPPRGTGTVLLVEDESLVRRFTEMVLTNAGYTVLAAERPSAAIAIANERRDPIDVVLTDVVLPEMNGRHLAARLTEIHPEAMVVFMSGYTDTAIVHQGVLDPGMRFLQKPFGANAVVEKVKEAAGAGARALRSERAS
jgi:PAS domain S-box-containing protein